MSKNHNILIQIHVHALSSHSELIEKLSPCFDVKEGDEVHIDLDLAADFIYPDYLLLIVSAIHYLKQVKVKVQLKYIKYNPSNVGYISRINFFKYLEHLGISAKEAYPRRPSKGRFLEITRFPTLVRNEEKKGIQAIRKNVIDILSFQWKEDEETLHCVENVLYEILGNVYEHSQEDYGWLVAQHYPKEKKLRLMVCDTGRGIHQSLIQNEEYKDYTPEESIKRCTEEHVSGVDSTRGTGLLHTAKIIRANKGILMIYSGEYWTEPHIQKAKVHKGRCWKGTIIYMKINTDVTVPVTTFS